MTVDYNLVILGDGPVARYAAAYARSLNARVALVVGLSPQSLYGYPKGSYTDMMAIQSLRHIGNALPTHIYGPYQIGSFLSTHPSLSTDPLANIEHRKSKINGSILCSLTQTLIEGQFEGRSLAGLEQLGIDVVDANDVDGGDINGNEQLQDSTSVVHPVAYPVRFYEDSVFTLKTACRKLSSQSYLMTMDGDPIIPSIPGIEKVSYSTLDTFLDSEDGIAAASILIVSCDQQGIEAACMLSSLGIAVTLIIDHQSIVNDAEAEQWLTTSVSALGVKIHWGMSVHRLDNREGRCVAYLKRSHAQAEDLGDAQAEERVEAIADHLLLAMGRRVDFTTLRLGTLGVAYDAQGIRVNSKYRSSHPRLFACGDAIGSPSSLNQRYAEVAIAVHYALFDRPVWSNAWLSTLLLKGVKKWLNPALPPVPKAMPTLIYTSPPLAYIGYSEAEARQRYGKRLTILRQSYGTLDQAQLLGAHYPKSTTGWCKLLVLEDGQIVGAYIWGVQAEEVVGAIALSMHNSIPMEALGQLCPPMPSITAEVLQALGLQWECTRIKGKSLLFDWLELVFNWQRDWTR